MGQHLQRHTATAFQVLGFIDCSHPAPAQPSYDSVVTELLAVFQQSDCRLWVINDHFLVWGRLRRTVRAFPETGFGLVYHRQLE